MTDEELIGLYFSRQECAIEQTDHKYGRYFRAIAVGILKNEQDADETLSDVYLRAWQTIPPERPQSLRAFLSRITRQLSINRLEHESAKKRGANEYPAVLEELADCLADPNGEDFTDLGALRDTLSRFIRKLPPQKGDVFVRRYWYLQSIDEIAKDCKMSTGKVKSMLMRLRKACRQTLIEEGYEI